MHPANINFPPEMSLQILSFVPSESLGAFMVASRATYALGQIALADRLKEIVKFWATYHGQHSKTQLGSLILRKWERIKLEVLITKKISFPQIREVLSYDRLAWSVISRDHPKIADTTAPHPSGLEWPILITEMSVDGDITESNPYVFVKELSKVGLSYSKSDCKEKFLALAHFNPVAIGLGERPGEVCISYITETERYRRLIQKPDHNGDFDYSQMVDKALSGNLRRNKAGKRMSMHEAEIDQKMHEAVAVHVLKKFRQTPIP